MLRNLICGIFRLQTCQLFSLLEFAGRRPKIPGVVSVMAIVQSPQSIRILVIDDERQFLEIIQQALEAEGCIVHTCSTPWDGIAFYEQHWRGIDVVLLDFMMPGMCGDQVYEHLKRINANVSACLVTSCDARQVRDFCQRESVRYLKKPFRMDDLIQCVRTMHCPDNKRGYASMGCRQSDWD